MGKPEDINKMLSELQREITGIINSVIDMVYFMRGAIGYEEMMHRTFGERQLIADFIEKRLKQESTREFPNY